MIESAHLDTESLLVNKQLHFRIVWRERGGLPRVEAPKRAAEQRGERGAQRVREKGFEEVEGCRRVWQRGERSAGLAGEEQEQRRCDGGVCGILVDDGWKLLQTRQHDPPAQV